MTTTPPTPDTLAQARAAFERGLAQLGAGQPAAAEAELRAALARAPGRPSVLAALGVALLRQRRAADALAAFDDTLAAEPQRAETWGHRGTALLDLGRAADALASFERALSNGAPPVSVDFHRALALNRLGRHAQALECLNAVQREHPGDAQVHFERALTLRCLDRHADALPALQAAVAADPRHGPAWSQLGQLLKDSPDPAAQREARAAFERAAALGEDAELHRFFLAALGAGHAPATAPVGYVQALFDGYATHFDRHADTLEYGAPTRLASLIATVRATPCTAALDLGCGSGLCAPALAALAQAIDGVDVSAAMLDAARAGGRYRALHQAEIVDWLGRCSERYGLVVAADVFIYVGALEAVFAGVRRVLDAGGLFALTAEAATGGAPFELLPTLRYAHDEGYLRRLAAEHGFGVELAHRAPLRLEQGQPLPGLYLVLRATSP